MRFIRDIIKEKRTTATHQADVELAPPARHAGPDPLVLDATLFHQDAEPTEAEEPQDALELPVDALAAPRPTKSTPKPPAIDAADDEMQALLRVIAENEDTAEAPEAATAVPTGSDPFDKLRAADAEPRAQSPSPMSRPAAPRRVKPAPQIADIPDDPGLDDLMPLADAMEQTDVQIPSPALGRGSNRSGRVKTRLLGFSANAMETEDPFEKNPSLDSEFPVGWLVVTSDQGRGASFALQDGVSTVGRGTDQTVCLNFGDNSISRSAHVSIAFDAEKNKFYIGHGGKSNLVRLNNAPLLSTEELRSKDIIRMGETTLRFIALCEGDFGWVQSEGTQAKHA